MKHLVQNMKFKVSNNPEVFNSAVFFWKEVLKILFPTKYSQNTIFVL